MNKTDFSFSAETGKTPRQVYDAIIKTRDWWRGYHGESFAGKTENVGDAFTFTAAGGQHVSRQEIVEAIPGKRLVWLVTDSALAFNKVPGEWTGTRIVFDISAKGGKTVWRFIHEGLTPETECFGSCAPAWTQYLENRLVPLIESAD